MAFHGGVDGGGGGYKSHYLSYCVSPKMWRSVVEGVVMNPQRSHRQIGYIKSIYLFLWSFSRFLYIYITIKNMLLGVYNV